LLRLPPRLSIKLLAAFALPLAALGLLAGCSGDEEHVGCREMARSTPVPSDDRRPRIEGRWLAVYAPLGREHREQRATWAVTPSCKAGPCSFRIQSDRGARRQFVYDPAFKAWTNRDHGYCVTQTAYWSRSDITLTPLRAVRIPNGTFATEMFGASMRETVRAIRMDPPLGKQQPVLSVRYTENQP
jgi:hypothetical protein